MAAGEEREIITVCDNEIREEEEKKSLKPQKDDVVKSIEVGLTDGT